MRPSLTTLAVGTALLSGALAPLNSTMIVVALPELLADLGASLTSGSWIIISYLVAMAAVQPLGGSLGDRYGRRRLVLFGLFGFLLASLAAALALSVELLMVARTAQAITGAITLPNGSALVRTLVPAGQHGRVFGLIGVGIGAAAAFGPPLGGLITEAFGWRWTFAANVALIVPAMALAYRLPPAPARAGSGRFDLPGAALLLTALVALALAATAWRIPALSWLVSAACGVVGVAALLGFRRHVGRVAAPVLDLSLFSRPGYLPAGLTVLFSNMTMYTVFLAVPVFVTQLLGWQAGEVGLLLAAMSLPMMLFGPVAGWLSDRFGRRLPAVVGCVIAVLGTVLLATIDTSWSRASFVLPLVALGAGLGISSAPVYTAALQAARIEQVGQAAGLFSTMRYLGSILSSAVMAAILGAAAALADFRLLFALLIAAAVTATVTAARLPARPVHLEALEPADPARA